MVSHFQFLITGKSRTLPVLLLGPKQMTFYFLVLREVGFFQLVFWEESNGAPKYHHFSLWIPRTCLFLSSLNCYRFDRKISNCWFLCLTSEMSKWNWWYVKRCKCKSLTSVMLEFLNRCQDGMNVSMCLGIMFNNNSTSEWDTFNIVRTTHLIAVTSGTLRIIISDCPFWVKLHST